MKLPTKEYVGASLIHEIEHRPSLTILIGLICGVSVPTYAWNFLVFVGFLIALRSWRNRGVSTAAFALGVFLAPAPTTLEQRTGYVRSEAHVSAVPSLTRNGTSVTLEVNGRRYNVFDRSSRAWAFGEQVFVEGIVRPPLEGTERAYLARGISGRLSIIREVRTRPAPVINRISQALYNSFNERMKRWLPEDDWALVCAIALGSQGLLSVEQVSSLKATGTLHIVAASGMQITAFALGISYLLRLLPIQKGFRLGIIMIALVIYCLIAGLSVAVVRAAIMFGVGSVAWCFRRDRDFLSAWAVAGCVITCQDPAAAFQIGAHLSFIVMLFLGLFAGVTETSNPFAGLLKSCWTGFWSSVPLSAFYFGTIPLLSLLANILVAEIVGLIFLASFFAFGISYISEAAAGILTHWLLSYPVALLSAMVRWLGNDQALISVPAFSGYWLLLFYGVALLCWRPPVREA